WRDVPAGSVDVVVALGRYTAEPEPLAVIDNVAIEVDKTTLDPRLQRLELRGRVPRVDVEVVDPDGKPLDHGMVTLLSPDTHDRVLMAFVEKGVAHLATTRRTLDLDLRATGYRSERLFAVTPPLRVVLRPGPRVVVAFEP